MKLIQSARDFYVLSFLIPIIFFAILICSNGNAQEKIYRYTIHGTIMSLPESPDSRPQILVRHEEVPDYVDETGIKVGMHAMTMSFTLADSKLVSGLQSGDRIEFVLESWWGKRPGDRIVEVRKVE